MDNITKKKIWIGVLSFIGFITTIKLAIIYYDANYNPYALASFCSINEFIDCDSVAKTSESQFWGIPLAYWGMFLYLFMIMLLFVDKLKNCRFLKFLEVFKNPLDYIASLGLISFIISMILLFISLHEIKMLCILCAATYILNFIIGAVAVDVKNDGFWHSIKQSFFDFIDAVKVKKYLAMFLVVMVLATGGLTYTTMSNVFTPQIKKKKEYQEFVNAKFNKYAVSGNQLGDKDGKVIVEIYSDYRCPMCRSHNIMMHKLAKELKNVKFVHHNFPLCTECNPFIMQTILGHEDSCMLARYAYAAEKQGDFWAMNTLLFDAKPVDEKAVISLAGKLGLDVKKLEQDANSIEAMNAVRNDIELATDQGFNGTPVTVVNGKSHIGIKTYNEFKDWLIEQGAVPREEQGE